MVKKIQIPVADLATTYLVGLDVGFGVTKAIGSNGHSISFPSVYGAYRAIKFQAQQIMAKYPGDMLSDDDGDWFVGELAMSQVPHGELFRLRGRTVNEDRFGNIYRLRFAKAALGKIFPGMENRDVLNIKIATGLPVDYMKDADNLKELLEGQHLIKTDQTEFIANVVQVMVMPQPYGTIYANTLTNTGEVNECHEAERTGVIDVGTYTIDVALDDRGEFIDSSSGTKESGTYLAQNHLDEVLTNDLGEKPTYADIEYVLRNRCLKIHGKPVDYTDAVEEAIEPVRSATISLINDKWRTAKRIDVPYLAGGGAYLVHKAVLGVYDHVQLVENAQFANAQGYLNYATLTEQS